MSGPFKLAIIVHGGAGTISKSRYTLKHVGVQKAVRVGYDILRATNNPVDAVEACIKVMDLDEVFNSGYGSVLTRDGDVEMDAIIIRGSDLKAGAVGALKHILHPISVARAVMERTEHTLLAGEGAEQFAVQHNFPIVNSKELTAPGAKEMLERILKKQASATTEVPDGSSGERGTVGAVAINSFGQLAAATSTGGISAKLPGRIGDTPIIGGGTLCDDNICGASATGLGEAIMRACLCSRIAEHLRNGKDPSHACRSALEYMTSKIPEGDGGAIIRTNNGDVGYHFNSRNMSWAYIKQDEDVIHYGIEKGDDFTTNV